MDINLAAIASIILFDLILSGDNAVVIGMAAARLGARQRRIAIIVGGGCAVGLRVLFTAVASQLLVVPLLQAIGGVLLIWVAYRLLKPEHADEAGQIQAASRLGDAIKTIALADVVMSLDNVLAVAAAAHGDVQLLAFGLALSIPIVLFGSGLVAMMMSRFPWLGIVGAAVLIWTVAGMILHDQIVKTYLLQWPAISPWVDTVELQALLAAVVSVGIAIALWAFHWRKGPGPAAGPTADHHPVGSSETR